MSTQKRTILVLTGMSGAGLSTASAYLGDMGYEVYDNFPLDKVDLILNDGNSFPLALSLNARSRSFSPQAIESLMKRLREDNNLSSKMVFMTCKDEILARRYAETHRPHPLAPQSSVDEGIARERALISEIQEKNDLLIDTTVMGATDLRALLKAHFNPQQTSGPVIRIVSFSYRMGIPAESNLVFDMRLLRNPHWDLALRPKTGQYDEVGAYIKEDPYFSDVHRSVTGLCEMTANRYRDNNTYYLTLAFGCTGGKHRSVFMAEQTAQHLRNLGFEIQIFHRELVRQNLLKQAS